jgi:4-amino-4-deoxy-L-arabinose transferase-like glycosyltransferase
VSASPDPLAEPAVSATGPDGTGARDRLLLVAAGLLAFAPFLGQTFHLASREVRHAEVAREMTESGDYLVPRLLGKPYVDKPPVLHAAAALLYRAAGASSLGLARVPSAVAGILGSLFLYGIGRVLTDRRVALRAALGALGVAGYAHLARVARPDMIFGMAILLSCLGFARGMRAGPRGAGWLALAGFGCGLATITKGPLGLVFPLLFPLLAPIRREDLRRPDLRGWLLFAAAACAAAALWVVPVYRRDQGEYLRRMLTQPDLEFDPGDTKKGPFWYLVPMLASFLPLTLFLPLLASDLRRRRYSAAAAIALAMFVVLSAIPKKRIHYLLPAFPFLSIAVAEAVSRVSGRPWLVRCHRAVVGLSLLAPPLYFGAVLPLMGAREDPKWALARRVAGLAQAGAPIVSFGGMAESVAFVGSRDRVEEGLDPEPLLARLREWGPGAYLLFPDDRRPRILRGIEDRLVLTTVLEEPLGGPYGGERWTLLRVDGIRS